MQRVEAVTKRGWTSVLVSDRGNAVRTDWTVEANEQPVRRRWRQDVEGSPFERLLRSAETEVRLAPDGEGGTRVTLTIRQRLRGIGALGSFLVRRAARKQADGALDALARLHGR